MKDQWFMFASSSRVGDWLQLGWLPHDSLRDCTHGRYRVLVEWVCCCDRDPPLPKGSNK